MVYSLRSGVAHVRSAPSGAFVSLREAVLEGVILEARQDIEDRMADHRSDLQFYELGRNEVRAIRNRLSELEWVLSLLDSDAV